MSIHEASFRIDLGPLRLFKYPGRELPLTGPDGKPTVKPIQEGHDLHGELHGYDAVLVGPYDVNLLEFHDGRLVGEPIRLSGKQIDRHPILGRVLTCVRPRLAFYSEASQIEESL